MRLLRNSDTWKQWLDHRQPAKASLKNRFDPKAMLCVWWNFEGVIHREFVPNGHAVDANLYFQQLVRVHEIFRRRYPALVNQNRISWSMAMRSPILNEQPWQKLKNRTAITPSTQPWSCAFRLPPVSIHGPFLHGRNFENIETVEMGLTEFFASKTRDWYCHGIINLRMTQDHRIWWSLLWRVD